MVEEMFVDRAKGELRIHGKRHLAIDAQGLCNHLDSLVGPTVAEVIVNNQQYRLGKVDANQFRHEAPEATISEIIESIINSQLLSGLGISKVSVPGNPGSEAPISIEIQNPCVKATTGAGKALLLSYWCGALATLLKSEFEAVDVRFNDAENLLKAKIVKRLTS